MKIDDIPASILHTAKDIMSIKIQGATNVALATFEAIEQWAKEYQGNDWSDFTNKMELYMALLSNARPNEPLAKNGVKYIQTMFRIRYSKAKDVKAAKKAVSELAKEYLDIIKDSKKHLIEKNKHLFDHTKIIFTHCHSSTAEELIEVINRKSSIHAVATETRPLYQGRITAQNLLNKGVKTTMIVDSAASYFIKDDSILPIDAIFLGSDEINVWGDAMNKIGSFSMSLAGYFASKPLYIVTPSLKLDVSTVYKPTKVELREAKEIWPEAPKGLEIINPAFDIVPHQFIAGYLTEFGLVKPEEMEDKVRRSYEWIT